MDRQDVAKRSETLPDASSQRQLDELQRAKQDLQTRNDHLSELYKTAHQFVDDVSHELRTPLTVIKEFTSVVRDGLAGSITKEQRDYLDIVIHRVDDLIVMVNDMLDVSRIENGGIPVARGVYRVQDIVDRVQTTLERKAAASEVRLELDLPEDTPRVYCDGEKIGRVIVNLVVNAVKFSEPKDRVRIWARHQPASSEVVVGIEDNGCGIAPENLQMIFERFSQVRHIRTSYKGFGLGLNIVQELVHLNFGEIEVESELDKGSTFQFTIPTMEPRGLLNRYLRRVEGIRKGANFVSLLELAADPTIRSQTNRLDDLEGFLQAQMRRSDLLFRRRSGVWLLIAPTLRDRLTELQERLRMAREEANRSVSSRPVPEFEMRVLGSWRFGENSDELVNQFVAEYDASRR